MKSVGFLFALFVFPFIAHAFTPEILLRELNYARLDNNLSALTLNEKLTNAAKEKGSALSFLHTLSHTKSSYGAPWSFVENSGYAYDVAGENLAVNFKTEADIAREWLNSEAHRANILHQSFTEVGIAATPGTFEGKQTEYVVAYFAKPKETVREAPSLSQVSINDEIFILLELIKKLTLLLESLR